MTSFNFFFFSFCYSDDLAESETAENLKMESSGNLVITELFKFWKVHWVPCGLAISWQKVMPFWKTKFRLFAWQRNNYTEVRWAIQPNEYWNPSKTSKFGQLKRIIFHHDNIRPHVIHQILQKCQKMKWKILAATLFLWSYHFRFLFTSFTAKSFE